MCVGVFLFTLQKRYDKTMTMPMFEGGELSVRKHLLQAYGGEMVKYRGETETFATVLGLEEVFCPVPPEQQNQQRAVNDLAGMLRHVLTDEEKAQISRIQNDLAGGQT
jgi:hypothetical protein